MTTFTLTGDSTYAGIVFTPTIEGVDQVEVTLPYAEEGESSFRQADHEKAEAYVRLIAAAPDLLAFAQYVLEHASGNSELHDKAWVAIAKATGSDVNA
jgi:hypothetical protein